MTHRSGRAAGRRRAVSGRVVPSQTGAPPQTGVPLARLLAAAPALDGAVAWSQGGGITPRSLATATSERASLAAAVRAGARVGSIVQVRPGEFALVHAYPGGPVVEDLSYRTDSGEQERAFTVYAVRGARWLGVSVPALGGHLGWMLADPARLVVEPARYEVRVSLARRELWLLRDGSVVLHTLVVIGAAGTPTPPGQFSVDDKLRFTPASPEYGIGVLALSVAPHGLNWRLWRVAIHGLNNLGQVGGTGSLGCVHVPTKMLRRLLARVPVGTPVDIRA